MFNMDKELLKRHMEYFVTCLPVPGVGAPSSPDSLIQKMDERTQRIVEDYTRYAIKNMVKDIVNELIDKMYTADDFEKDIGLR